MNPPDIRIIDLLKSSNLNGTYVEVGVLNGRFLKNVLNWWNGNLFLIDTWPLEWEEKNHSMFNTMRICQNNEDRTTLIRSSSNRAVKLFEDNSIDFIFIDANHSYDSVKEDLNIWYPKVKDNGIISVHDFIIDEEYDSTPYTANGKDKIFRDKNQLFGANKAIEEFCSDRNIPIKLTTERPFSTFYYKKTNINTL